MIKQAMAGADLSSLAVIGVVMFAAIFLAIIVWTFTRSRRDVAAWSSLPLAEGTDPVQPRGGQQPLALKIVASGGDSGSAGSCGRCENCDCA